MVKTIREMRTLLEQCKQEITSGFVLDSVFEDDQQQLVEAAECLNGAIEALARCQRQCTLNRYQEMENASQRQFDEARAFAC